MATTTRQTAIFGVEDWKRIYQTYREADLQSYDFETLRKSFIDYLRLYYPETFNDYTESSEFIALLDVMAFMGQALSFRNDLNTRENFLDTAERRDSVVRLAQLVGYTPKRNTEATGYIKVVSVTTTENVVDYNGTNLSNVTVNWNDATNANWFEQFSVIINSALSSSQRIGKPGSSQDILGIQTDEYTVNLVQGFLPVIPYTSTVNGIEMSFEAVSASTQNANFVYEPSPRPNGSFNILYRNDRAGYASANTGFFFYFKQGSLQNLDFNLAERVSNRTVPVNIEGINNSDVWLYSLDSTGNINQEWTEVDNIYAAAVEQTSPDQRQYFSVTSRNNDQINLNFGDGVFSDIPVGTFRTYVRASNGLRYIINPEDMQNVQLSLAYTSRAGRQETITFTCALSQPVSNATNREGIADIKGRAPAQFYTQNRMVNGEDYNNLPYSLFSTIIKSKAVNRSSIGTSRYLDLVDVTGKYSSTNVFASDGLLYETDELPNFNFTFLDINDINNVIVNSVEPVLKSRGLLEFYYNKFTRPDLSSINIEWIQSTTSTNQTTGYFRYVVSQAPAPVGSTTSDNKKYIIPNALVKFTAPSGYHFMTTQNNRLMAGTANHPGATDTLWATISSLVLDGTNFGRGNLANGIGPVAINQFIPTGALATQVIPVFVNDLPSSVEQSVRTQIELYRDFGLGYNNLTETWYVITSSNLDESNTFSFGNAQNTSGTGLDNSWLIKFTTDGVTYTTTSRSLNRYFGSIMQTRFFWDGSQEVYDSKTGKTINDYINILKVNNKPDVSTPLNIDEILDIVGQPVEADGFVDDFRVQVSFGDFDNDNVPDNPDYFQDLVAPTVNPSDKLVFLQRTTDFDNLERYLPLAAGVIVATLATKDAIELVKSEYADQQVFYATTEETFYILNISASGVRTLSTVSGYEAFVGRQDFSFQYRHNSPLSRRIDPGTTNIIDVYLVTSAYYLAYQNYVKDSTNTVPQPSQPTIDQLSVDYNGLNEYKMLSDNVILNSVTFKPLFGTKASTELRATIKCIKNASSTVSNSEIKSRVVAAMNDYFTIDKWDFGDTFFFSELSAYLHDILGDIISTVVLVPLDPLKSFGDLYEIRSQANEIFVNAATVNDVEVISALTSSQLRSGTPVSGLSVRNGTSNPTSSATTSSSSGSSSSSSSGGSGSSGGGGGY